MTARLNLADLTIEVDRKPIKHLHLGVYPPDGRVRVAAPERMTMDAVRLFAISKLPWIKRQRQKLLAQAREAPREYLERESHYVWGRRYLLNIVEADGRPSVELKHRKLQLRVRAEVEQARYGEILDEWYRASLRAAVEPLLYKWEPLLNVKVKRLFVQRMRTKWGSCNSEAKHVRLNTELAKKPPECLEYILVHELVHLRFRTHGPRFVAMMDAVLPQWRDLREMLNQLPLTDAAKIGK
ncbi:MAG: SprT family zinc-dependent metalloprotease [Dokdonella sp.]